MTPETFDRIAVEEWNTIPERFKKHIDNVVLLIEDEPSAEIRKEEKLDPHTTLLGLYRGVPQSARGAAYGIGGTLPDTITLFRKPILNEAAHLFHADLEAENPASDEYVRRAIRQTIWHEVGHYFGLPEEAIDAREGEGTNEYRNN